MISDSRLAFRKPLLIAFLLGCTVSCVTSAGLTARIVIPATVYWSFIPLVQIASLPLVCWADRDRVSLARAIDRFFAGYLPWTIYLIGLAAIWSFLSPPEQRLSSTISVVWLEAGALVAALWSVFIYYRFFRFVLCRTAGTAVRDLLIQRFVSWSVAVFIIGAPTVWSELAGRIGR